MKFPVFRSPLVMRRDTKQPLFSLLTLFPFLLFQGIAVYRALSPFALLPLLDALMLSALAIWHTYLVRVRSPHDVTAFLPSVLAISAERILFRLLNYLFGLSDGFSLSGLLLILLEVSFWAVFAYFTVQAVCGHVKLIVPLLFLFFGFFYAFIEYALHSFVSIAVQVFLLILLWLPIDGVTFMSYPDQMQPETKRENRF